MITVGWHKEAHLLSIIPERNWGPAWTAITACNEMFLRVFFLCRIRYAIITVDGEPNTCCIQARLFLITSHELEVDEWDEPLLEGREE